MEVKPFIKLNPYNFYNLLLHVKPLEQYVKEITDSILSSGEYNDEARKNIFGFRAIINNRLANVVCDYNNKVFYIQSNSTYPIHTYFEYKINMYPEHSNIKWFFKGLSKSKGFLVPYGEIETDVALNSQIVYFYFKRYVNNVTVIGDEYDYETTAMIETQHDSLYQYYQVAKLTNSLTAAIIHRSDFEKSFIMPSGSHSDWKEIRVESKSYSIGRYRSKQAIKEIRITAFKQPTFCELSAKKAPSISFSDTREINLTFKFTLEFDEFNYIVPGEDVHYYTFIAELLEKLQLAEMNSDHRYIEHVCNKIVEMDERLTSEGFRSCSNAINPEELMNLF